MGKKCLCEEPPAGSIVRKIPEFLTPIFFQTSLTDDDRKGRSSRDSEKNLLYCFEYSGKAMGRREKGCI